MFRRQVVVVVKRSEPPHLEDVRAHQHAAVLAQHVLQAAQVVPALVTAASRRVRLEHRRELAAREEPEPLKT